MGLFYDEHPYPAPRDDIDAYRRSWNDARRRADSCLFWPGEPYRDDRKILVAGCGTRQAPHYAVRWPKARVVGIDISETCLAYGNELKRKHGLRNLELRRLGVEQAAELAETFDHVVCTGVLHHLTDPDAGLRALREVLAPSGSMHLMVYAPYGRAGIYMLQEYCRCLGTAWTEQEIRDLVTTLAVLPDAHPLARLLHRSPDFASMSGIADALLHPQDRAYSVPQFISFLERAELAFGRWVRQAPYLPWCGAISATPHACRLQSLAPHEQYAEMELFRGTMVRHSIVARHAAHSDGRIDFESDAWLKYVPVRVYGTTVVRDGLPEGASAVLINRNHSYSDLYMPVTVQQEEMVEAIDGERTIAEICSTQVNANRARAFFEQLWRWDQVVFDTTRASGSPGGDYG